MAKKGKEQVKFTPGRFSVADVRTKGRIIETINTGVTEDGKEWTRSIVTQGTPQEPVSIRNEFRLGYNIKAIQVLAAAGATMVAQSAERAPGLNIGFAGSWARVRAHENVLSTKEGQVISSYTRIDGSIHMRLENVHGKGVVKMGPPGAGMTIRFGGEE